MNPIQHKQTIKASTSNTLSISSGPRPLSSLKAVNVFTQDAISRVTSYYSFTLSCANLPPDLGPGCLFFFLKTQHISTGSLFVLCGHLGMAQLAPFIFTTSVHTSLLCSKGLSRKLNGQMLNQLENATKGKKNSTFS